MNRAQPPRGSPLGIQPWLVPGSFLYKQKCSRHISLGQGETERHGRARPEPGNKTGDSVPKRSSWARAWRMREAPMRELIEAERAVA